MRVARRSAIVWAAVLALGLAPADLRAESITLIGDDGAPGETGDAGPPPGPGGAGGDGESLDATVDAATGSFNFVSLEAGDGGDGGAGGGPLGGPTGGGGSGGTGGDATAVAELMQDSTFERRAIAEAFAGDGGASGPPIGGMAGAAGSATATATAENTGDAVATALAEGGDGAGLSAPTAGGAATASATSISTTGLAGGAATAIGGAGGEGGFGPDGVDGTGASGSVFASGVRAGGTLTVEGGAGGAGANGGDGASTHLDNDIVLVADPGGTKAARQVAIGGNGGTGKFGLSGSGGDASSRLDDNGEFASIDLYAEAFGGDASTTSMGDPSLARGGHAVAEATTGAMVLAEEAIIEAEARGGDGGTGASGDVSASATARAIGTAVAHAVTELGSTESNSNGTRSTLAYAESETGFAQAIVVELAGRSMNPVDVSRTNIADGVSPDTLWLTQSVQALGGQTTASGDAIAGANALSVLENHLSSGEALRLGPAARGGHAGASAGGSTAIGGDGESRAIASSSSGSIELLPVASGGDGSSLAMSGVGGMGGNGFVVAEATTTGDGHDIVIGLNSLSGGGPSARGGSGGGREIFDDGFVASSGSGGEGTSRSTAVAMGDSTVSVYDLAEGGHGGFLHPSTAAGSVTGNGGVASSTASGSNAGPSSVFVRAAGLGGDGGGSSGSGSTTGDGATAVASASGSSSGGGDVTVVAIQRGGDAGTAFGGGARGTGAEANIEDAVTGSTSGHLLLVQDARAGEGESAAAAISHLTGTNPGGGTLGVESIAAGGTNAATTHLAQGGVAWATANANSTTTWADAMADATAGSSQAPRAGGGHALADARAEALGGMTQAMATTRDTAFTEVRAMAYAPVLAEARSASSVSYLTATTLGGGVPGDADAFAEVVALPVSAEVDDLLMGNSSVASEIAALGGSTFMGLVTLGAEHGQAGGAAVLRAEASFTFGAFLNDPRTELMVGLVGGEGDGFEELRFVIELDGVALADQTFASVDDADAFFDDEWLDLGEFSSDAIDGQELLVSVELTASAMGDGYRSHLLLVAVPEPGSAVLLSLGLWALALRARVATRG